MDRLIGKIKEGCSSSCLVLAPRRVTVNRIRKELVDKLGFIFDLKIMTVPELLKILTFGNQQELRMLPDEVAAELLGQLALSQTGSNKPFLNLLKRPSGQRLALNTIQSLINAEITPEMISSLAGINIRSIYSLYRDYCNFCLANNIADRALWQSKILKSLEEGHLQLPDLSDMFIFDFNSIPLSLARLLRHLEKKAHLHFAIPFDPEREEHFTSNSQAISQFTIDKEQWCLPYSPGSPLEGIQKNLFGNSPLSFPAPGNISFHKAPGRFDEVEAAAVAIKNLILKEGIPPSRIALSTRNLGTYNQFIEAVMHKLGIPYTYRRGTPILQSPLVRLIMKLLECKDQKVTFQRLLAILRSRFLKLTGNNTGWQKIIVEAGIFKDYLAKWPQLLKKHYLGCKDSEELVKREQVWKDGAGDQLIIALELLNNELEAISQAASPLKDLERFCNSGLIRVDELPDDETWQKHQKTFTGILEKLINNNDIIRGLGLKPLQTELDQLREELKQATIHEKQYLEESVKVITTFDLGYLEIDHLFLIGMDEHTIPKPSYSSNLLLSDADIFEIKESDVMNADEISSSHSRRIGEEQAFILAIAAAAKSIHLYHASVAGDGRELSPSPYFAELLRLAGNPEVTSEPGGDSRSILESVPEETSIRNQLIRHLYRTDIITEDATTAALADSISSTAEGRNFLAHINNLYLIEEERTSALFNRSLLNKWSGLMENSAELAEDLKLDSRSWSATAIQTFASCPFDFFLRYVLFLEEMKLPGEEPDPMNLGSLYHRILEKFVNSSQYPLKSKEESLPLMHQAIASELPEFESPRDEISPHTLLLLKKTSDVMERFINFELLHETGLPYKTEYKFDGDTCRISLSDGSDFRLKGIFDRVDTLPDNAEKDYLIIDYKLGSGKVKAPTAKTFSKGRNLQMPLYLLAASQIINVPLNKLQGLFLGLKHGENGQVNYPGGKAWQVPIRPEDKESSEEKCLMEIIEEILQEITQGQFPVFSRDGSQIRNMTNLVGRWLELPPELAESGE